jgi:hypothetical protein
MADSASREKEAMDERQFWLLIRRALLMICAAIEQRYGKKVSTGG